jgi:hypothetical protein
VALVSGQLLLIDGGWGAWPLAALIVTEQACETLPPALVAVSVKLLTTAAPGTPLTEPAEASARPTGSEPAVSVQVIGEVPVAERTVW